MFYSKIYTFALHFSFHTRPMCKFCRQIQLFNSERDFFYEFLSVAERTYVHKREMDIFYSQSMLPTDKALPVEEYFWMKLMV